MGDAASGGIEGVGGAPSAGVGSNSTMGGSALTSGSGGVDAAAGTNKGGEGGAGGAPESSDFATNARRELNGFMLSAPCLSIQDVRVCYVQHAICPHNDDPALNGLLLTDQTLHLGGDPTITYELTLHVQGLVEAKSYEGGVDQLNSGEQTPADGWYTGGVPDKLTARSVYMIRVGEPARDYFLNSIGTASDTRVRYSVFPVDYFAKIRIQGGSSLRLVVADSNCGITRNCADPESDVCKPLSLVDVEPAIAQHLGPQPYDGQFLGLTVANVAIVQ